MDVSPEAVESFNDSDSAMQGIEEEEEMDVERLLNCLQNLSPSFEKTNLFGK